MRIEEEIKIAYEKQTGEQIELNKESHMETKKKPMISFLMCTYNDASLLKNAIYSLIRQEKKEWELIVLDNSDKSNQPWEFLENIMNIDNRIYAIKNETNIGWAKGASSCLKYAKGEYISFLAADDCITSNALKIIDSIIEEQNPDIIWVGNSYVEYYNGLARQLEYCSTNKQVYPKENRSEAIVTILQTVYYNSFFHYVKKSLLDNYKIDFYYPYFGDCAGMTKALSVAETMVVSDEIIYLLTINTSQTMGYYIWDSYKFIFASQWNSVREVFYREGYFDIEGIKIVAKRIERNHIGVMKNLIRGNCRNRLMNQVEKDFTQRVNQLKTTLENECILEMMEYFGRKEYYKKLEDIFYMIYPNLSQITECNWLVDLIRYGYEQTEEGVKRRNHITKEEMENLILAVSCKENYASVGFELVIDKIETISKDVFLYLKDEIESMIQRYQQYVELQLENLWENYIEIGNLQSIYKIEFYGYCNILYQDVFHTNHLKIKEIGKQIETFLVHYKEKKEMQ